MSPNILNKYLEKLGIFGSFGYIFFSVIPFAIAGKHICTGLMLIAFIALLLRGQIRNIQLNWLSLSLYLVLGLALISAMLSPYATNSFNQLRKDGLPFLVTFLLLINVRELDRAQVAVYTTLSLVLGYVVKELLALWAGVTNDFQFSIYEIPESTLPKYLNFFSADTPYYLPFLLGPLFFWPLKFWQKISLLLLTILAVAVVLVSGVRTAFAMLVAIILTALFYRFWRAKKVLFMAIIALALCGYLLKDRITNPSISRYATITSPITYQLGNDGSISERYAIIKGVWEVSKDRFFLGFGPDWKKLSVIAEANGHMNRWRNSEAAIDKLIFSYFSNGEGRVNPHNLYLATLFQEGLLGLMAYLLLMIVAFIGTLKIFVNTADPYQKGIASSCALYLSSYFVGGMFGGAWLPINMLVTLVCLAQYQRESN